MVNLPKFVFDILKKRRTINGLKERLGIITDNKIKKLEGEKIAWFHAVSVGETAALEIFLKKFRAKFPEFKIIISTVTDTGQKRAESIKEKDAIIYLPLDLKFIAEKTVDRIKPDIFIILETEIWPHILRSMKKRDIKTILINGRISDRSYGGYSKIKCFLKKVLSDIDLILMQTPVNKNRIISLGANPDKVHAVGNIKFDFEPDLKSDKINGNFHKEFNLPQNSLILIAASTHSPEEEIFISIYKEIAHEFPDLYLVVTPRHPERRDEVVKICIDKGYEPVLRSKMKENKSSKPLSNKQILILDTIGELLMLYSISDIVFVGKSLVKPGGGHNILEPAALSKPVIWGQYMSNFPEIEKVLLENKAGIKVYDSEDLKTSIIKLLKSPDVRYELGIKAYNVLIESRGSTNLILEKLTLLISNIDDQKIKNSASD
jgi:3-deoxy-D-manno-octulosonic-acid transferase